MANQHTSEWNDDIIQRMLSLAKVHKLPKVTKILNKEFGTNLSYSAVRTRHMRVNDSWEPSIDPVEQTEYRETIEYHEDGSITKNTLIEIANATDITPTFLLQAHGFKPSEWKLVNGKNSVWNQHNKEDGTVTLYSSKITVKPKENELDISDLENIINKLPTIHIPKNKSIKPSNLPYLNIPLYDMHWGIADYNYYKPTQQRILHYIEQGRKDILIPIGQDLFHNDDMRGRTSSGREIEKVDMEQAFEDAWKFYSGLIESAIKHSEQVHVYYSIGNHDEFSGWSFVKALEKRYNDQVIFDTRFKERKVHMLGTNFVGMNHSDKKKLKKLPENFSTEFPLEWSRATTREVLVGHEHTEEVTIVSDSGGLVLRRMPTGNITDGWHDSMGYTTAHKRFQILEYSEHEVKDIHYV